MNYFYEWPKTRQEYNIFFKEVFRLPNFWKDLGKKVTWGLVSGGGDLAVKLAVWQYMYGGTWSPEDVIDYNTFKPLICGGIAFGLTGWLTVPFENASRAYYADKTWPVELRRNYTSPTQALLKIPFQEGPGYLFRGAFPTVMNQTVFFTVFMYWYQFLKTKFFFFWTYHDKSYNMCKSIFMLMSYFIATCISYPFYYIREMVDLWPKERGGFCTWQNNYRNCFRWMIQNMDVHYYNYLRNMTQWHYKFGYKYLVALWMADNLGMISNGNESWTSMESQFYAQSDYM